MFFKQTKVLMPVFKEGLLAIVPVLSQKSFKRDFVWVSLRDFFIGLIKNDLGTSNREKKGRMAERSMALC